MSDSNKPQLISLVPNPPVQGQNMKICLDWGGIPDGTDEVELEVTWTPGTIQSFKITLKRPEHGYEGCSGDIPVHDDAEAIMVKDLSGNSRDKTSAISPPP